MKILILFAHPAFHKSKVNKILVDGFADSENITFHDLYHEYPEMDIEVKREQELLKKHDLIIFHFPFFWYSTPAILKEWQDLVLEHGWAFGSKGNELKGKYFLLLVTTGGPKIAYVEGSFHNHTMNQLLSPLKQTFILCKMKPVPPFIIHGTHAIELQQILDYRKNIMNLLNGITKDQIDLDELGEYEYMNDYIAKQN